MTTFFPIPTTFARAGVSASFAERGMQASKCRVGIVLIALFSLGAVVSVPTFAQKESSMDAITTLLKQQSNAWNEGDLPTFMAGYVKTGDLSFFSSGGELHGFDALRARYEKRYGTNKESMGKLQFTDLHITDMGPSNALCLGHWHLERTGQDTLDGLFTLVLQRTTDGWKIFHDHTSVLDKK